LLEADTRRPLRVAVFAGPETAVVDPAVVASLKQAAAWLEAAGCHVEESVPPGFAELSDMFFSIIKTEESEGTSRAIERLGDDALRRARAGTMALARKFTLEEYVAVLGRRTALLREWNAFLERYDVLLLPVSYQLPMPINEDQKGNDAVARMIAAHQPMLAISTLGLPSLAMPTGFAGSIPTGLQIVAGRFKEEVCLRAGAIIEAANGPRRPIEPH
jgi:amidase